MRRDSTPSRSLQRPLAVIATAIVAAAVFALFLTVISFGILAGVGAIVIGLTAMLGGLWLLLNRAGIIRAWIAAVLILGPSLLVYVCV